ncbi:hypothetical protein ACKWMY_24995 [Serratia sp. J2]|uniref:hypothetical protein n=1 Tax=Serratia sp. J2 TaxID=3386551 RepID=UPI003916CF9F
MAGINNIQMHRIEMSILSQCELMDFAILEAISAGDVDYYAQTQEQTIIADERLTEKNALCDLVEFCKSYYDRDLGFQSKMDDGIHCFYTCSVPADKFISFAQTYPPFIEFLEKMKGIHVDFIEISLPEKIKKIVIDEFVYDEDSIATIFMEKHNDKEGGKFLIYANSKYGSNITKITYMLERLYDCEIELAATTNAVKLICQRLKEDIKNKVGIKYINELMEPFEDEFQS